MSVNSMEQFQNTKGYQINGGGSPQNSDTEDITNILDNIDNQISAVNQAITSINDDISDLNTNKQNKLTFDTNPVSGSANPVTSGGILTALNTKQNKLNVVVSAFNYAASQYPNKIISISVPSNTMLICSVEVDYTQSSNAWLLDSIYAYKNNANVGTIDSEIGRCTSGGGLSFSFYNRLNTTDVVNIFDWFKQSGSPTSTSFNTYVSYVFI